jgi:hypothetical protein
MIFVNYPGHFIAGLLLVGFAVLIAFSFRSKELQKAKLKLYRPLLALLQYGSIVILLFILWNPSGPKVTEIVSRNSVLALFDTSESMSVVEDGRTTRLDKAFNIFEEKFRPSDPEGPDYKIFGFDRQAYHSGSPGFLRRWGSQTNMHSALALLGKYDITEEPLLAKKMQDNNQETGDNLDKNEPIKKNKVVGAVIFTDGQADDKNIPAYLPLGNKDFQIVLIGVGSKEPQSDIAIKSISAPSRVAIDTAYKAEVVVVGRNLQSQPVTIELLRDDYVVDSKELAADRFPRGDKGRSYFGSGRGGVTVEFTVGADRLGGHTLSARAKAIEQEVNLANNVRSTMVEVIEEAGLKVLFYSQGANFNIGKIRQALARDSKIQLDLGLDVIITPKLSRKALERCGYVKLPSDREGFYKYDIIILGPCVLDSLTEVQVDGLYSFVVDRGGGLILLPGRAGSGPANWRNEKAKALVPVILDAGKPTTQPHRRGKIELTVEGIDSKVISRAELRDYDEPTSAYYRIVDKKPAATTLAFVKDTPIVSVHRVGRGRVCMLNASKLFLWYREDLQGGLLYELMSGLTAYIGRVTNLEAAIELFAERVTDQTNKVKFDAYICDKMFAPVSSANVLLTVGDELLSMDEVGQGYYVAEIEDVTDEAVIATVEAEVNGTFLGEKTIAVNLPLAQTEMTNIELDEKFLQALAKKLNGKYFGAEDIDENITEMFGAETRVGGLSRMTSIWPTWPLLLVLCLLLSVDWFLRRAVGLV